MDSDPSMDEGLESAGVFSDLLKTSSSQNAFKA
jgi:hypothetical protein